MVASAVIIEPQDETRETAVEMLEKQGFDVTEYAGWKPDFTISDGTTFCLVEAKTLDEHREILDEIRSVDESLPVFVVGPEKLSRAAVNAALEAGMVQWVLNYDKAVDAAVQAFRAMMKRASAWRGSSLPDTPAQPIGPVTELHDPESGRIDAARVATYLGLPLAFLAKALGRNYSTVAKTPAAESLQESLRDFKRVIEVLQHVLGDRTSVRIWMNTPHPDLGQKSPRDVAEMGKIGAVRRLLDSRLSGNLS
ncbi:MAG TPA: antitoxin Xre/MbcA/ParS toxin-binding domain-containing protein [Thermoanaerobaculia bacterium]|nr:antitoxin Xre/MbcA/ParS toxin-binding domain-containing protein [Thermoanaerobaculia bacterium]